jgi:hypothetical protein
MPPPRSSSADPGGHAPSHNVPGDTTAKERLDAALAEYKRRIAGVQQFLTWAGPKQAN